MKGAIVAAVINAVAVRAELVDAMFRWVLQHGAQIAEILNKCAVWVQYKGQRYDLFIPAKSVHATAGVKVFV